MRPWATQDEAIVATPSSALVPARGSPAVGQLLHALDSGDSAAAEIINSENDFSTFTLFGQLPTELRLLIWTLSVRSPWTLDLKCRVSGMIYLTQSYSRREAVPAILHANQESHSLALKTYKVFHAGWTGKPVYFDFTRDTFNPQTDAYLYTILIDSGVMQVPWAPLTGLTFTEVGTDNWPANLRHIQFEVFPVLDFACLRKFSALERIVVFDPENPEERIPYKKDDLEVPLYGYTEENLSVVVKA